MNAKKKLALSVAAVLIYSAIIQTSSALLKNSESRPITSYLPGINLPFGWESDYTLNIVCDESYIGHRGFPFKIEGNGHTQLDTYCSNSEGNTLADLLNKVIGAIATVSFVYFVVTNLHKIRKVE